MPGKKTIEQWLVAKPREDFDTFECSWLLSRTLVYAYLRLRIPKFYNVFVKFAKHFLEVGKPTLNPHYQILFSSSS